MVYFFCCFLIDFCHKGQMIIAVKEENQNFFSKTGLFNSLLWLYKSDCILHKGLGFGTKLIELNIE